MGRQNQQRRKAKAKARAAKRAQGSAGQGAAFGQGSGATAFGGFGGGSLRPPPPPDPVDVAAEDLDRWWRSTGRDRSDRRDGSPEVRRLLMSARLLRGVSARLLDGLHRETRWAWEHGWEPADVLRIAHRRLDSTGAALTTDAVAASIATFADVTVAPRWHDQLAAAEARVWWPADTDPIRARIADGGDGAAVLAAALDTLDLLGTLPPLQQIEAPPGRWRERAGARRTGPAPDKRMLERVRQLLAQAESTTFEAEAETFTAAAQSLMARHSIDEAMVAAAAPGGGGDEPVVRRVGVDRPYESPKVALLGAVADANRSRTVWSKELGFVTVIGFAADLDAIETLFTSLLVQATRAMTDHGSRFTSSGQSRTRSFRQSFLLAFATRIGQRLAAATEDATQQAQDDVEQGGGRRRGELVRVLDQREREVDDAVSSLFPELVSASVGTASNREGWVAGTHAATAAALFSDQVIDGA